MEDFDKSFDTVNCVITREMFDDWLDVVAPDQKERLTHLFALMGHPTAIVYSGETNKVYSIKNKLLVTEEFFK